LGKKKKQVVALQQLRKYTGKEKSNWKKKVVNATERRIKKGKNK